MLERAHNGWIPPRNPGSVRIHRGPGPPGGYTDRGQIRLLLTHTRGAHAPGLEPQGRGALVLLRRRGRGVRAHCPAGPQPRRPPPGGPCSPLGATRALQVPAPLVGVRAPEPLPALLGGDSAPWWPRGRGGGSPGEIGRGWSGMGRGARSAGSPRAPRWDPRSGQKPVQRCAQRGGPLQVASQLWARQPGFWG